MIYDSTVNDILGDDIFMGMKKAADATSTDDTLAMFGNWPASQPMSPLNAGGSSMMMADDRDSAGYQRARTPSGRSPRLSRTRPMPNLYNHLRTSPMMQHAAMAGFSPLFTYASPTMQLMGASPIMQPAESIIADGGADGGSQPTVSNNYDWMQAGRSKRRRGGSVHTSPLMKSTTLGMMQHHPYGSTAPVHHNPYMLSTPPMDYQQQPSMFPMAQLYELMARSQYPQRPPKVAMPPAQPSPPSGSQHPSHMILPFKLNSSPGPAPRESAPGGATDAPPVVVEPASKTSENRIISDMTTSCLFFRAEVSKINWEDVTVTAMKSLLKRVNQNASGRKEDLIARVKAFDETCEKFLLTLRKQQDESAERKLEKSS